ncbi:kinase-like protein [Clavulina sp. PMI_390]|nr:kinase-like protein [Clavulina sp. PMI_390]
MTSLVDNNAKSPLLNPALDDNNDTNDLEEQNPGLSTTVVPNGHDLKAPNPSSASPPGQSWGFLRPFGTDLPYFECKMPRLRYVVGRAANCDFVISNQRISAIHCTITYDLEDEVIRIQDSSTNGTYVNNDLIGQGRFRVIIDSSQISFARPGNGTGEDIRFFFERTSRPIPKDHGGGLYKDYQVMEYLGKGGFGIVHKLHNRHTGGLAAVKIFGPDSSANFQDKAKREIDFMIKLSHPNIVTYIKHYQDTTSFYIVMELAEGGDLQIHINKQPGGRLEELEANRITRLVCNGLAYIHSQGIAHRDLKPANILLAKGTPKIADFGLAKIFNGPSFLKTVCGTPAYIAPEVSKGPIEAYSLKADSWSMGVIVYAMLTGHKDFHVRFHGVYKPDGLLKLNVSREVQNWVIAMLKCNPESRFSLTQALDHPWLKTNSPNSQEPTTTDPIPCDLQGGLHEAPSSTDLHGNSIDTLTPTSVPPMPQLLEPEMSSLSLNIDSTVEEVETDNESIGEGQTQGLPIHDVQSPPLVAHLGVREGSPA